MFSQFNFIAAALSVTTHVIRSSQEGVPVTLVSSVAVVFIILLTGLVMVITIVVVAVKWFGHSKVVLHVYGDHLDIHESPSSATLHTYALKYNLKPLVYSVYNAHCSMTTCMHNNFAG